MKPGFNPILKKKKRKSDVSTFQRYDRVEKEGSKLQHISERRYKMILVIICGTKQKLNPAFESWAEILLRHPSEED
jgi:hypothetical protein